MTSEFDHEGPGREDGTSHDLVEIDLNFDTLRTIHAEFAPNLCRDGLFIGTREPLPPSTLVRFRILLPGDFVLAEGTAVVEWTREPGSIPGLPPGMALRFVTLGDSSQETIDEIVDSHIAAGGLPFELEPSIGEPGEIPTDALAGRDSGFRGAGADVHGGGHSGSAAESYRLTLRAAGVPHEDGARKKLKTNREMPSSPVEPGVQTADDILPSWLREQAEAPTLRRETDPIFEPPTGSAPRGEGTVAEHAGGEGEEHPVATTGERDLDSSGFPETSTTSNGEFDVTFMDDRELPDDTTVHPDAGPAADVTVVQDDVQRSGSRSRAWLAVPAALVILGALGAAWWFLLGPGTKPTGELPPSVTVDEQLSTEPEPGATTIPSAMQPTALPDAQPVAEPPQEIEHEPPQPSTAVRPVSRILQVAAEPGTGETVLIVRGNGPFLDNSYRVSTLTDPNRVLVRIRGIESGYAPTEIEVGSPEVERIRIGHHPEENPPSLYVVLDLAGAAVDVRDSGVRGDTLTVTVGRP